MDAALTSAGVHGPAVADDEAVALAGAAQLWEGVLDLDHGFQEVLLEFEGWKKKKIKC